MKNLQSLIEGAWIELKQIQLTVEQKTLILSQEESDNEAKAILIEEIKTLREVEAQEEDALIAQAKYYEIKPTLKQTDVYQLISFDTTDNRGILNCRVNGEHKQIRF